MTGSSSSGEPFEAQSRWGYLRWGGFAAALGPLLVLVANGYQVWVEQTYGAGPAGMIEAATATHHVVFGGVRLLGGTLLVFGLIALYASQLEAAGHLGVFGFVVSMVGTVLLAGQAWFVTFFVPALATEAPRSSRRPSAAGQAA